MFITSSSGVGDLSTWLLADQLTGLQAGDRICQSSAALAGIPDASQYVAWLSDGNDDAYCRVHGQHGSRITGCTDASTLGSAGPWYRMDGLPAIDIAANSMPFYPEAGYVPRTIEFDEYGNSLFADDDFSSLFFSGTQGSGVLSNVSDTCSEWTAYDNSIAGMGQAYRASGIGGGWSAGFGTICANLEHLACMKAGANGPAFAQARPHTARLAFTTSSVGTGNLGSWPDAGGAQSTDAADLICRAHASRAQLPLPQSYRAWISSSQRSMSSTLQFDGAWYRTDGARVASSKVQLFSGKLEAPMQVDESGNILGFEGVWTGTRRDGSADSANCQDWSADSNMIGARAGTLPASNYDWTNFLYGETCSNTLHLNCFADNDSLFLDGFGEN